MVSEGRIPEPELMFHMTVNELHYLLQRRDPTIILRARLRRKVHSIKDSYLFPETNIGPNIKPRNVCIFNYICSKNDLLIYFWTHLKDDRKY